jgi:resuscitation-promoting factor RpfA
MSTLPTRRTGRNLLRLAVVGAVAVGAPLAAAGTANAAPDSAWDRLAQCESGGNWSINTGNGYHGGLQFSPRTWSAFGGGQFARYAYQASRAEQIVVAERVLAGQGWGAWPACSSKLGLRGIPAEQRSVRAAAPAPTPAPAPASSGGGNYTVRAGDTLSKIAARHGTTWQALHAKNRGVVSNPNVIRVGQVLSV